MFKAEVGTTAADHVEAVRLESACRLLETTNSSIEQVAKRAGTPKRFLEHILLEIRDAGVISSKRGRAGGYVLVKRPGEVKLSELLRLIDGPLAPLPCLSRSAYQRCPDCTDEETCRIRKTFADVFWTYLLIIDSLTLADLMRSGELASRVIAEP